MIKIGRIRYSILFGNISKTDLLFLAVSFMTTKSRAEERNE